MSKKIDNVETVGGRLRHERRRVGLTQNALAEQLGIHRLTQMHYESGATEPPTSYIRALRGLGIDDRYVQTGIRSGQNEEQSNVTERLFMALCDALQIPLDKVHSAISGAASGVAHSEFQGHVRTLMHSSVLLNSKNKVLVLDRDILVDIINGFERCLEAMNKRVSPLQKAHYIASMYRDFCEKGEIDTEMLEAGARSIPEA